MRVLVVGGTGHIGSYLVPRLITAGYHVQVVSRNPKPQYCDPRLGWQKVEWIVADRREEEKTDKWQKRMLAVETDVVMDLLCFTPEQNRIIVEAFEGRIKHFIHCGTIWAYGTPRRCPYKESDPRNPITEYGQLKAEIELDLLDMYQEDGFPVTIIHPGHISAPGWMIIDPQGSINRMEVYENLATGKPVHLPDEGRPTIHHVHGDDVAQMFELAMIHRETALGESFSNVSPYALSLTGCCEYVASLFGRKAVLEFTSMQKLKKIMGDEAFEWTKVHVDHSPCCTVEKAERLLGYHPRFTTEQIYKEWIEHALLTGKLKVAKV